MRDELAEKILAKVLDWTTEDISKERPDLTAMARYKYDDYQYYFPGMRFTESLSQWLKQFDTIEERQIAYDFIKTKLLYFSSKEISQLVSVVYPDFIKPILLKVVAKKMGIPEHRINQIVNSEDFAIIQRQTLFLGLSDGAHMDIFRRQNKKEISYEQTFLIYDFSDEKADELVEKLKEDIEAKTGKKPTKDQGLFKNIFLLDDFSGSGLSYIRKDKGQYKGKIWKVFDKINHSNSSLCKILDKDNLRIYVVLYTATEKTIEHLKQMARSVKKETGYEFEIIWIQKINQEDIVNKQRDSKFCDLIEKYYDPGVESDATIVGGTADVKYGFAYCSLPLVLRHNTPNNSVCLLWSYDDLSVRGLFPRVTRH